MLASRSSSTTQQSGAGKLIKVVVGGKPQERGKPTSHVNCK
jgi:hypothetical protein